MIGNSPSYYKELGGPLLASVSRSFFLSMRWLPPLIRPPISLAYLLARATDTIADTPEVPLEIRLRNLRSLRLMIRFGPDAPRIETIRREIGPLQTHKGERQLLEQLDQCLDWLDAMKGADQHEIRTTLDHIGHGQELDLVRFGELVEPNGISARELDEYTHLVAGCVGEFWTRICALHLNDFATLDKEQMLHLGGRFGKGLQLVNILRDLPKDLKAGRCYLPADQLQPVELKPATVLIHPERAKPIIDYWLERASQGLDSGWHYVRAVRSRRLKFACAVPALLGVRTLALLRAATWEDMMRGVKVPRTEVRTILLQTIAGLLHRGTLESLYARLKRSPAPLVAVADDG